MLNERSQLEAYRISKFEEPYLYSINGNVFENASSKVKFEDFLTDKLRDPDYFYIILGCDSGLLMDYVINHSFAKGSKYLFIDSEHVIDNLQAQLSFTETNEDVILCTLGEWEEKAFELKLQGYMYTDKVRYLKSIAATDCYDDYYNDANATVSSQLENTQYLTQVSLSRAAFVITQTLNLANNINPLMELADKFKGMSCVILGGGPSLDEIIDWLKTVNNDVVIMAVSRVAKRLQQENIKPHFIISVDPHDVSFDVSKEMLSMADSSVFLHSNHVVPKLVGQWSGLHYFDGNRVPWPSKLNKPNIKFAGPTVTNSAISAAVQLGFENIYLSGVDLCYASNGVTHAKGSNESKLGPMLGKREQWVTTYGGNLVETMMTFIHASKIISQQAVNAQLANCTVYNLSPNAAKVEHITQVNPETLSFENNRKPADVFDPIKASYKDNTVKEIKAVLTDMEKIKKEVNAIAKIAKKAVKDNAALYKKYSNTDKAAQIKHRIDQAEKKLKTKHKEATDFIQTYGINRFIRIAQTDGDSEWSDEKMEKIGETYYQAFVDTINEFVMVLNMSKETLEYRLEEYVEKPNFKELIKHWNEKKLFARAIHWSNKNKDKYALLTSDIQHEFECLIKAYEEELVNTDTYHYRRTKAQNSLDGIQRKASFLFKSNNSEALEHLINNLAKLESSQEVTNLSRLCSAYLAILQNNAEQALNCFNQLPEEIMTEDELIQMAAMEIKLERYQQAESHLAKVSSLNAKHLPMYARLLTLNGKINESIGCYQRYLDANPEDINVLLSLGKLLSDIKENESAQQIFMQILALDETNIEAKHYLDAIAAN